MAIQLNGHWGRNSPRDKWPQANVEFEFPILGMLGGEPVPDLALIPEEKWVSVLQPLSRWPRHHAFRELGGAETAEFVFFVKAELENRQKHPGRFNDTKRRELPTPVLPKTPNQGLMDPDRDGRRPGSRQVNLRFVAEEYDELKRAGELNGMRPTRLARLLVRHGVARILYEERAAIERRRSARGASGRRPAR